MIRFLKILAVTVAWILTPASIGVVTAQSGLDNWRSTLGTFKIGIVLDSHIQQGRQRLKPFQFAVQQALGMPVEIVIVSNFNALIEAQINSKIEYAVYSASAYGTAWNRCRCVQPLVAPFGADGSLGFRSVLLVDQSQGDTLDALKGKVILLPGRHSFAGYLFPVDQLREQGTKIVGGAWRLANSGNMEAAVADLLVGKGVGLFGWEPYYGDQLALQSPTRGTMNILGSERENFKTIWRSAAVPYGPHTVRSNLDERAKLLLWDLLTSLKERNLPAFEAISPILSGGFNRVTRSDFEPVIRFIENQKKHGIPK